jgi:hypothetical protein
VRDIGIKFEASFLSALPREFARGIIRRDAPQHAIGIDRHTRTCATADRVAAATAAAELSERSLLGDQEKCQAKCNGAQRARA